MLSEAGETITMKSYIGIDPGIKGGLAILCEGAEPFAVKMPATERDIYECLLSLTNWKDTEAVAVIEKVNAVKGNGVVSMITFGMGYGGLRMALIALGIPFREVTPQTWQKALGCSTGGNKNVSKAKAQQLFPSLKITHAIADSLLIAEWLRRQP